jgi:3-methyladenine DNA glycosylase AlkC
MDNPIFVVADRYRKLREQRDEQAAILKEMNANLEKVEAEFIQEMVDEECGNLTRGNKQFVMTITTRWSANKDRKDELYAVLRQQGFDHLFSVNAQTLGSFVREQAEENADRNGDAQVPDWLSGLVRSYDDVGITMKSVNKKT